MPELFANPRDRVSCDEAQMKTRLCEYKKYHRGWLLGTWTRAQANFAALNRTDFTHMKILIWNINELRKYTDAIDLKNH